MNHIKTQKAVQIEGEEPFLNSAADNLADANARLVYADWLEEQGDPNRAEFLRAYSKAFDSMNVDDFPDSDSVPASWANTIGASLVHALAEHGISELRDELLKIAKPSLVYEFEEPDHGPITEVKQLENDAEIPVGGSKIFGLPDLPAGATWPCQKDCNTFYDTDSGIAPDTPCGFVCQINFAELAGTQASRYCPEGGLLSIFSCAEIESIGMVDAYVVFTPQSELDQLVRMTPPDDVFSDEANALLDAIQFEFTESLVTPWPGEESPFATTKLGYDHDHYDPMSEVIEQAEGDTLNSFLGYTRPTSGDDPLPGGEWCKLICVPNTIEMMLHFCIKNEDLAAGKFDDVELAWVDFD